MALSANEYHKIIRQEREREREQIEQYNIQQINIINEQFPLFIDKFLVNEIKFSMRTRIFQTWRPIEDVVIYIQIFKSEMYKENCDLSYAVKQLLNYKDIIDALKRGIVRLNNGSDGSNGPGGTKEYYCKEITKHNIILSVRDKPNIPYGISEEELINDSFCSCTIL